MQGELFRAHAHIRPRRENFFAHEARQDGGIETNNTNARPQTATIETTITSAPENTEFASAMAMTVSTHTSTSEQRRHQFQTTGRAGLQGLAVAPMGGGGAWPSFDPMRRAEGSQRGRRAGGPPPTGTHSGPASQSTRGTRNTRGATSNTRKQERRHRSHNQGKQKPQILKGSAVSSCARGELNPHSITGTRT